MTHHEITINTSNTQHRASEILDAFRAEYQEAAYALDEYGSCARKTTWYDAEKQLGEFSKRYPKVLFTLYCEGETGNIWKLYVINGRSWQVG